MKTLRHIFAIALSVWLVLSGSYKLFGQEHSTQGTDFWLTFLTQHGEGPDEASIIISAEQACSGLISNPNTGWSQTFSIGDNGRLTIVLPNDQCYIEYTDIPLNLGINITSTDTISVYSMSYKQYTFDGSNILPTVSLKSNYVVQAYEPNNEFAIVATEDNTIVDITPTSTTMGGHQEGYTYTINLNRGQVYQVNTENDLSGSTVTARDNKKIAVFAGNICVNIPYGACCCDHVYEQMLPTEYWGKKFALTKTYGSNADRIRITALNDTTLVTLNGSPIASLSEYETFEFELSANSAYIESNKPILTESYITGQEYRNDKDPSMVTINPIEQVIDKIIFGTYKKDTELTHYVNIVTSSNNITSVKLDGNYVSGYFSPLTGNVNLSYARIQISHDTHILECENGLVAHVYGIGNCESYAYSVGSSTKPINDIENIYVYDSICHGEDYTEYGFNIVNPEVGELLDTITYTDEFGITKLVNLTLTVNPAYDTTFYDTICRNESYNEHGFALDSLPVGWHFDTINPGTILGCDSLVYLELYVAPIYDTTFYDTICRNESYNEHGFALDSLPVGWHFDTINPGTILGCDSLVYLELYVAPIYDTTFYDTICRNESYNEHGFALDSLPVGWHFDTINPKTVLGCDSIVYLELFVAPIYDTTFIDSICRNESYNEHGFALDSLPVGWHFDTINPGTALGCDSLVYLELYVTPSLDTTFYDTVCFGNGYHEHGFDLDSLDLEIGVNYDTLFLQTTLGCDSLVYLELYVTPSLDTTFYDTVCFGNGYHEHGFDLDSLDLEIGMNFDTLFLTTTLGCDSIVYLELLVGDVYEVSFTDTTCVNEGYHKYGFDLDSLELGWRYDTLFLSTIVGCDSTVTLELYVAPVFDTTFFDTICFGNNYFEHGFSIENPDVGWNFDTLGLSTTLGCDSIVYLELYVAPTYDIVLFDSICFGESYHLHGFDFENPEVGTHSETHESVTALGCDSIVAMNLFVGEVYDIQLRDTICFGEDYDKYNFHFVNPPVGTNSETQSLSSMYGCDSTVNLKLYVAPVYRFTVYDSICEGDDYNNYGLHITQPQPGMHSHTSVLKTELGCDSIFDVNFKVIYTYKTPDTLYGLNNVYVSTNMIPGKYRYWIDTITGCKEYHWELSSNMWVMYPDRNECTVIVTTPETTMLTVIAGNSCGEVSKSIEIHAGYFGVGENEAVKADVYPNPSDGIVNVVADGIEAVNILNATGAVVKSCKFEKDNLVSIDISELPNSIYVLEIVTRDGRCIRRITKTGY